MKKEFKKEMKRAVKREMKSIKKEMRKLFKMYMKAYGEQNGDPQERPTVTKVTVSAPPVIDDRNLSENPVSTTVSVTVDGVGTPFDYDLHVKIFNRTHNTWIHQSNLEQPDSCVNGVCDYRDRDTYFGGCVSDNNICLAGFAAPGQPMEPENWVIMKNNEYEYNEVGAS